MANPQIANSNQNSFGAAGSGNPSASNLACKFRVRKGGRFPVIITNPVENSQTMIVSLQVSSDNSTYNATTSGNNVTAITNDSIVPGAYKSYDILLREGTDQYVRLLATGNGRGEIQSRHALQFLPL